MRIAIPFLGFLLLATAPLQAAAPDSVPAAMAQFRLDEAASPVRERARWRVPRKVVLIDTGLPGQNAAESFLRSAAPGVNLVVVRDISAAAAAIADADVIIGPPDICDPRILDGARELRWLAALAAGVERCAKVTSLRERQVLITNMRGVDSAVIAEHAIAMMLALAHGLDLFAVDTYRATWNRGTQPMQMLDGKKLLVSGLGSIGTEVARRAAALGMRVVATRDRGTGKPDFVEYIGTPEELLKLAREADVIVSALPLTRKTTGVYDAKFFAVLKPTTIFVNVGRGGSVVTNDLLAALNEKRIAGAGLDVVDPEPLPRDHPLWRAPRVLISPHISTRSDLPGDGRWIVAGENLRRYAAGEKMLSVVDLEQGY